MKTLVKVSSIRPVCWHFCWHREIKTIAANFAIPYDGSEQMARKSDGPPTADLADVDCRAVRPKFDIGDGPLALFGSRTKLMQHWADRIDHWLDPKKAMSIKGGAQA